MMDETFWSLGGLRGTRGRKRSSSCSDIAVSFQSKRKLLFFCNYGILQGWRTALQDIENSLTSEGVGFPGAFSDEELWSCLIRVLASPGGPEFARGMLDEDVECVLRELHVADLDFNVMSEGLLRRLCHVEECEGAEARRQSLQRAVGMLEDDHTKLQMYFTTGIGRIQRANALTVMRLESSTLRQEEAQLRLMDLLRWRKAEEALSSGMDAMEDGLPEVKLSEKQALLELEQEMSVHEDAAREQVDILENRLSLVREWGTLLSALSDHMLSRLDQRHDSALDKWAALSEKIHGELDGCEGTGL